MVREIGSEFHRMPIESGQGLIFPQPGSLVFSGRTAIETVLKKMPEAQTALLPSYCCDSMLVPFRAAGIAVNFYDVKWNDGLEVRIDDSADILLWCNYFGYRNELPEFDGIIVEDITHSLLSSSPSHDRSDYLVASVRKWEPINCGGYCSVEFEGVEPSGEFVDFKTTAMKLKAEYLEYLDERVKPEFLQMFGKSNHWLSEHYSGLSIDPWSNEYINHVDMKHQRETRRNNAKVLYDGLKGKIQFMFPIDDMDCPLFVPVLLPRRDEIRAHLIKNEIYCPVHWPKPEGCVSNIYDLELSLICDQRYGIVDMERIVSTLKEVL